MSQHHELPEIVYLAITEETGAELIEPGSELDTHIRTYDADHVRKRCATHVGDILLAPHLAVVISPETIGLERAEIARYRPPTHAQHTSPVSRTTHVAHGLKKILHI